MNGWHQDSVLCYAVDMSAAGCCDVLLTVRHTMDYPYQNLWLFVDEYVDSVLIQQDTVEAMLADDYGRWLGNGYYRYELSLLYDEDYCFSESSQYTFSIRQGMRSDWLQGITDVGLKVIRK
jgi:gliding motility-associated lipoprotein GldH